MRGRLRDGKSVLYVMREVIVDVPNPTVRIVTSQKYKAFANVH